MHTSATEESSMKINLKGIFVLVLLLILEVFTIVMLWIPSLTGAIIPLTRLSAAITYLALWLIWPIIGGMIMAAIIPRILGPIFLKIKRRLDQGVVGGRQVGRPAHQGGQSIGHCI